MLRIPKHIRRVFLPLIFFFALFGVGVILYKKKLAQDEIQRIAALSSRLNAVQLERKQTENAVVVGFRVTATKLIYLHV